MSRTEGQATSQPGNWASSLARHWPRIMGRRQARTLATLAVGALGAAASMMGGGAAVASGTTAGAGEPGGGSSSNCPATTSPNAMTLMAGTPQTTTLNSAYATALQVALTNTDGCEVSSGAAGVAVTFTAPSGGASGVFSASGANTVTVGADSSGAVVAPTFTANGIAGSYTVTASSQYGTVTFSLTNTAAGTPARIVAVSLAKQTATVSGRYRQALAARVLDGEGNPVAGVSVTFTLTASTAASSCGTDSGASTGSGSSGAGSGADASFAGGASEASATSNAAGVATSPALTANGEAGTFSASAALGSSDEGEPRDGGSSADTSTGVLTPALFTLSNLAGAPAKLAPGVGATQSTRVGARFPVSLAVTVTDALGNRVPNAFVSFTAPSAGAGGHFTTRVASRSHKGSGRERQTRVAKVKTNACGIAVAPAFTANRRVGGYIVKASAGHARAAAFALVNEAP